MTTTHPGPAAAAVAQADPSDLDGAALLSCDQVAGLLRAAVAHGGGRLTSWRLDHIDAQPGHATTATYLAVVDWPFGPRRELLGASARVGQRLLSDERAVIFADGRREVAVWLHPHDPDLPGLARCSSPAALATLLNEHRALPEPIAAAQVAVETIGYRPRRRAVLKARVHTSRGIRVLYVKVLREEVFGAVQRRHELLLGAGVPAPPVLAATSDHVLVLAELTGRPLATAIFDPVPPCRAEDLVALLDAMPTAATRLPRRAPWVDALDHYADVVASALPHSEARLARLTRDIRSGLAASAETEPVAEPTHGDLHEGQLLVTGGAVSGLLDVDTVGPGRRVDDLACLVGHLSTVQRMNPLQAARVQRLLRTWLPVFDARVDPIELRLRAAGVVISLATGPYRGQEQNWRQETEAILDAAERLVRSAHG
jgi:aminoglycoside phosphotransferase